MLIIYILMIICRYFGPNWLGAEFVRGRDAQYLIMHVIQCAPTDLVWCLIHSKIVGMTRKYYTQIFANGEGSRCAAAPEPSLVAYWVIVSLKAE